MKDRGISKLEKNIKASICIALDTEVAGRHRKKNKGGGRNYNKGGGRNYNKGDGRNYNKGGGRNYNRGLFE